MSYHLHFHRAYCTVVFACTLLMSASATAETWVAVGYGGRRMVSDDGVNWEITAEWAQPGADDSNNLIGVVHAKNKFVAVGGGGGGPTAGGHVLVSEDGRQWRETWKAPNRISPIAFGNDVFLAGGPNQQLYMSDDAETWKVAVRLSDPRCTHFRTIAFGNGVFVVTGNHGGNSEAWICVTDGKSILHIEFGIPNVRDIYFAEDRFVVVGKGVRLVSEDGVKWNSTDVAADEPLIWVTHAGGKFLCGGYPNVYESSDGLAWSPVEMKVNGSVMWTDGKRMIGSGWPGKMFFSSDLGKTWQQGNKLTDNGINSVASDATK